MFKLLFRKRKKFSPKKRRKQNKKTNASNKAYIRSIKFNNGKNYYPDTSKNYIYPAIIIFLGFISLSLTILLFAKQIEPFFKNERLKFLCTYQIGDKKNKNYKEAKIKLDKMVEDGDKFCKNFIFPKEKNKRRFRIFPIMKDILFRFI